MPELRIDPICGRRVYIAEERLGRPNDFVTVETGPATLVDAQAAREGCPFCAGHESATPHSSAEVRDASGRWRVRVVPNKYPAVNLGDFNESVTQRAHAPDLRAAGAHEVIIESPLHVVEITDLDADQLAAVLAMYRDRLRHWSGDRRLKHAIVFKNSGFAAGASLEHVHSQLVALPYVPNAVQAELDGCEAWFARNGRCVFCEIVHCHISARKHGDTGLLVLEESGYAAVCAYAGRQPFETWILPTRHASRFDQLDDAEIPPLAAILRETVRRIADQCRRYGYSLAYNLVLHTAPSSDAYARDYHWHWELIPRTTHLAGLEWGAGVYINPVSPERAARELRAAASP
jgi:UDPglucose--hexose-1-phosphate uridylyltransferase